MADFEYAHTSYHRVSSSAQPKEKIQGRLE